MYGPAWLVIAFVLGTLAGARVAAKYYRGVQKRLEMWRASALHFRKQRADVAGPLQALAYRYRLERDFLKQKLLRQEMSRGDGRLVKYATREKA